MKVAQWQFSSVFLRVRLPYGGFPIPDEFTVVEQFARTERIAVRFFMGGDDPVLTGRLVKASRCRISACGMWKLIQHVSDQFSQDRDIVLG